MVDVLNKSQNYILWQSGNYGNKLRSWITISDWQRSGFGGNIGLRMRSGFGGGKCIYNITPDNLQKEFDKLVSSGVNPDTIMINEMAPNTMVLQGEYFNGISVVNNEVLFGCFLYSTAKLQMREALRKDPKTTCGLVANLMLQHYMTSSSWEDWQLLIDQYQDHVLEVSIYQNCLGDTPNRNALVWEVRKY